jgi:MoaA/NifB/PqqE/SkfB family radical SAM enzyme
VANIRRINYPGEQVLADMRLLLAAGVKILMLYGGEPFLWRDDGLTLRDVVVEAKQMGFVMVNVVTNGTFGLDLPEADLIMVSVDGTREHHDEIRGTTYDRIMAHIEAAPTDNICLYMAINCINLDDVEQVCQTAQRLANVRAVSFNLHTPYPGTEHLALTREQRQDCCDKISGLIRQGYPILNLASTLPAIAENDWPTPCHQCLIVEDGQQWVCGRCVEVDGLCEQCGYLFSAELSLLFSGKPNVIADAVRTYGRYL